MIAPESSQVSIRLQLRVDAQDEKINNLSILGLDEVLSWLLVGGYLEVIAVLKNILALLRLAIGSSVGRKVEDTIVVDEQLALVDCTVKDNLIKMVQFGRTSLTGFPAQSVRSSNTYALDSPYLLVLNTGTSQSRQHDMSESDSYYLSD
ncbi:hypothetical protein Tco_0889146 [Tanacetum coccineum]